MKLNNPIIRIPMPISLNDPVWPVWPLNCRQAFLSYYFSLFLILIVASILSGCGASGGSGKNDSSGSNPGQVTGIGTTGGSATSNDSKTKVVIPSGALNKTTDISVAIASAVPAGSIGNTYDFKPEGTIFNQPVNISIVYDPASLPSGVDESTLRLAALVNNAWEVGAGSTVDVNTKKVSGDVTHFSIYGIIASLGGFSPTGSMGTACFEHNSTLLSNGKVLIVEGRSIVNGSNCSLASAELYDPAAGTFSSTGSMNTVHYGHTATLLSNGKLLIAGGVSNSFSRSFAQSVAEIYDPASGTFSRIGGMITDRHGYTATLLANGKVLVSGGKSNDDFLDSAELFQ
ncbi:MAG: hypothetical protein PH343_03760 [Nitrospira sp.]|nr:hypothetical protein [Nitrospira sp.]